MYCGLLRTEYMCVLRVVRSQLLFCGDAVDVVAEAPVAPASLFEKLKAPAAELARNLAADLETLKADLTPTKEEAPPPPPPVLPHVSSSGSSPPSADGKEVYLFS